MSAPTNGYSIRLVYYGRADLMRWVKTGKKDSLGIDERADMPVSAPQISTQNVRIVPFSRADDENYDYIGIYELVKNAEAPKSDLEGTKL